MSIKYSKVKAKKISKQWVTRTWYRDFLISTYEGRDKYLIDEASVLTHVKGKLSVAVSLHKYVFALLNL